MNQLDDGFYIQFVDTNNYTIMRPRENTTHNTFINKQGNETCGLTLFESEKRARNALDTYLCKLQILKSS